MRVKIVIPQFMGIELLKDLNFGDADAEAIVIDSEKSTLIKNLCDERNWVYIPISQTDFSHGGTRNLGAQLASERGSEILVFMTQDAVPAGPDRLDHLVAPIRSGEAVATFARQLPRPRASVLEEFSRYFNYPAQGRLRTRADIPEMGVKAFFFSNVCSAVRADVFWELGGFPDDVIMNEDMLMAAKVLRAGYRSNTRPRPRWCTRMITR